MKLHIGSKGAQIPGFKKLDLVQWGDIDYVQDAKDLSNFKDGEVEEIYASHILEHFKSGETLPVLREWHRVLIQNGVLYISVPNFDVIVKIYLNEGYMNKWIQDIIHGNQDYETAVHYRSFTKPVLMNLLHDAGFRQIQILDDLPYGMQDCSKLKDTIMKTPISINMMGVK